MASDSIIKRLPYIDNARAFAILCVVLGHVISQIIILRDNKCGLALEHYIVVFDMPLFTILSGYCGINSMKRITNIKEWGGYLLKQFRRLLMPAIVIGGLTFLVKLRSFTNYDLISGMGYWYLAMLFYVMSISSFFVWTLKKTNILFICAVVLAFSSLLFPLDSVLLRDMMPYFVLGILCKEFDIFEKCLSNRLLVIIIFLLTFSLFLILDASGCLTNYLGYIYTKTFGYFVENDNLHLWVIRLALCAMTSLAIIGVFRVHNSSIFFLTKIGSYTLPLYIFSNLFFWLFNNQIIYDRIVNSSLFHWMTANDVSRWLSAILVFALITLLSWMLILICNRFEFSRKLFLGKFN